MDIGWMIIKASIILAWFIGVGIVSASLLWFFSHFEPTAKYVKKFFKMD